MKNVVRTLDKVFAREACGAGGFVVAGRIDELGRTVIKDLSLLHAVTRGGAREADVIGAIHAYPSFHPEWHEKMFFSAYTASTAAALLGRNVPMSEEVLQGGGLAPVGAQDAFALNCHAGPLQTLALSAPLRDVTVLSRDERSFWGRTTAHIGAAFRLRRAGRNDPDHADAVLLPSGKIEHLTSDISRKSAKDGFVRRRRARSRGTTAEAALEVWQGLHDGRWSLVDYIDKDGKAFVLAVRNEPAREVASTLTDRQRAAVALAVLGYGNKQIAYALGLTAAAVTMLLARARIATRVRTRTDLVRAFKRTLVERPS